MQARIKPASLFPMISASVQDTSPCVHQVSHGEHQYCLHMSLIDELHSLDLGLAELALVSAGTLLPGEQSVAVLVKLELVDHNLGGVNADLDGGTCRTTPRGSEGLEYIVWA